MRDSRTKKGGTKATGRPRAAPKAAPPCDQANTLDGVFATLDETQTEAARKVMSEEEWKFIQAARKASTERMFDGLFRRLIAVLKKRGDDGSTVWVKEIGEIIGPESMMELGKLLQQVEHPTAAAS